MQEPDIVGVVLDGREERVVFDGRVRATHDAGAWRRWKQGDVLLDTGWKLGAQGTKVIFC